MEARDTAGKAYRLILKGAGFVWAWSLKFLKIRFLKHKLCKAQRNLDLRMSRLGSEIYSLHRQGETEFLKSLVVRQQLKIIEEAESRVLGIHDRIDAVEREYLSKKEAIRPEAPKNEQTIE
jgi:hypothetical protein